MAAVTGRELLDRRIAGRARHRWKGLDMNARKALTMLVALTIGGLAVGGSAAQATATAAKPMPAPATAGAMADDLLSMADAAKIRMLTPYESVLRKFPRIKSPHD